MILKPTIDFTEKDVNILKKRRLEFGDIQSMYV